MAGLDAELEAFLEVGELGLCGVDIANGNPEESIEEGRKLNYLQVRERERELQRRVSMHWVMHSYE